MNNVDASFIEELVRKCPLHWLDPVTPIAPPMYRSDDDIPPPFHRAHLPRDALDLAI